MDAAEVRTGELVGRRTWAEICERCRNEWVCLFDVDSADDGSIRSARVLVHSASMRQLLAQLGGGAPNLIVVHTSGRPSRSPRTELTDEIRNIVRARR